MRIKTVAIAAFALLLPAAASAHAGGAPSRIKGVEIVEITPGTARYDGRVQSPRHRCERNRKVTVVHVTEPRAVIGRTFSDGDGDWSVTGPLPPSGDRIVVKAKAKPGCARARRTYEVVHGA